MAAYRAATLGAKVVMLEKTDRIGTKILISGGGKCNITHDGPIPQVLKPFRRNEANFLKSSCFKFTNEHILEMLTSRGLNVYTREDGRIFPVDQTAKDVVRILHSFLREAEVDIKFETPVTELLAPGKKIAGIRTAEDLVSSKHVILCVGGSSYPRSGTTGDGFRWAQSIGHTIVPIRAALAPMHLVEGPPVKPGVALRQICLKARIQNKVIASWMGDLLFTHTGVSGPCALGISREVSDGWATEHAKLEVDLIPKHQLENAQQQLIDFKSKNPNRPLRPFIESVVPNSVAPELLAAASIASDAKCQTISNKQLNILAQILKAWPIGTVKEVDLAKGEVVAGGISLDEADPQTMRSKVVEGLYLAGEVLDIAGPVGGYNLQAAWSTGYIAGQTAAQDWLGS